MLPENCTLYDLHFKETWIEKKKRKKEIRWWAGGGGLIISALVYFLGSLEVSLCKASAVSLSSQSDQLSESLSRYV